MLRSILLIIISSSIFAQISLEPAATNWLLISSANFFDLSDHQILINNNQIFVFDLSQSSESSSLAIFEYEGPGTCLGNQDNEFYCVNNLQTNTDLGVLITKMDIFQNEVQDAFAFSIPVTSSPVMINNNILFQSSKGNQATINIFDTTTQQFDCSIQTNLSSFIQSELSDSIVLLQTNCQQCQLVQTSCSGQSSFTSQLNFPYGQLNSESLLFPLSSGSNQILAIFPFTDNQTSVTTNGFYVYNSSGVSSYTLLNNTFLYVFQSGPASIVTINEQFQIIQYQFEFESYNFQQVGNIITLPAVSSVTFSNNVLLLGIKSHSGEFNLQINIEDMTITDNSISSFDFKFANGSSVVYATEGSSNFLAVITSNNIFFTTTADSSLIAQSYTSSYQALYALEIFPSSCTFIEINLAGNSISNFDIAGCDDDLKEASIVAVLQSGNVFYFAVLNGNTLQIYNTQQFLIQTIQVSQNDADSFFFSSDANSMVVFEGFYQVTYDIATGLVSSNIPVSSLYQVLGKISENLAMAAFVNNQTDTLQFEVIDPYNLFVLQTMDVSYSTINNAAQIQTWSPIFNSDQTAVSFVLFSTATQSNLTIVDANSDVLITNYNFNDIIITNQGQVVSCSGRFNFVAYCTTLNVVNSTIASQSSHSFVVFLVIVLIIAVIGIAWVWKYKRLELSLCCEKIFLRSKASSQGYKERKESNIAMENSSAKTELLGNESNIL